MKSKLSHILKDQARQMQPEFDPVLHERILQAVRSASVARNPRRARLWRLPGIGLALAIAACVVMALTVPLMFQNAHQPVPVAQPRPLPQPQPPMAVNCPTPRAILALNIEPAGKKILEAISPDMSDALASLNEIPRFFKQQINLIEACE